MLTIDFRHFPVDAGDWVLDLGCGEGRHSYEALRRGAQVIAFDHDPAELGGVADLMGAMMAEGQAPHVAGGTAIRGDALALPFAECSFDRVIAAEILEHVPQDEHAIAEIARVLRPGGLLAVTVPRWLPERVCWALSEQYHSNPGGHVRIYTERELADKLSRCGLRAFAHHHAHALHSPYWWLKCAVGVERERHPLTSVYHRMLVWDLMRRPLLTRAAEQALNPVLGKSLVMYLRKPQVAGSHVPTAHQGGGTSAVPHTVDTVAEPRVLSL